jgi:ankyrin repeat protein
MRTKTFLRICSKETLAEVKAAIKNGADVNITYNRSGDTALMYAAEYNKHLEVTTELINKW